MKLSPSELRIRALPNRRVTMQRLAFSFANLWEIFENLIKFWTTIGYKPKLKVQVMSFLASYCGKINIFSWWCHELLPKMDTKSKSSGLDNQKSLIKNKIAFSPKMARQLIMTHWQEYMDTGRISLSLHEQICLLFQWDELTRKKTTKKNPKLPLCWFDCSLNMSIIVPF